jgi:peroxiredoxin
LRDNHDRFSALGAAVLAVAPEPLAAAEAFLAANPLPFPLAADEGREVFARYGVESRLRSLGQRPALFVIDRSGRVRANAVGTQQWDIPAIDDLLELVAAAALASEEGAP